MGPCRSCHLIAAADAARPGGSGAKRLDQLEDNLAAVDVELTAAEIGVLDAAGTLPPEHPGWMSKALGARGRQLAQSGRASAR